MKASQSTISGAAEVKRARPQPARRARIAPLPPAFPQEWAVAHGEDLYGLWQAFEVAEGVRQVMRWIPPGVFVMGSPRSESGREDDEEQHLVDMGAGFWLADTACTQALWSAVMDGDNPSHFSSDLQNPVEQVSWEDVVERFLAKLESRVPGLNPVLPSEAQWEYACRAEAQPSAAFWFGEHIDITQVNHDGRQPMRGGVRSDVRGHTVAVKALPCNGWGLYQMHGNVWEWCADWYGAYPAGGRRGPSGWKSPSRGVKRVLRGGSWLYGARQCRSAQRDGDDPGSRYDGVGFRLARAAS